MTPEEIIELCNKGAEHINSPPLTERERRSLQELWETQRDSSMTAPPVNGNTNLS